MCHLYYNYNVGLDTFKISFFWRAMNQQLKQTYASHYNLEMTHHRATVTKNILVSDARRCFAIYNRFHFKKSSIADTKIFIINCCNYYFLIYSTITLIAC